MFFSGKSSWSLFVFAAAAVSLCCGTSFAQKVLYEAGGIIIGEAESTESSLGAWVKVTMPAGFTGTCGFEFTGNSPSGGSANSPLVYKFKVNTAGVYRCAIRAYKRLAGSPGDLCNDCWWKVEGDYTAAPGGPTVAQMTAYAKFFCYGLTKDTWDFVTTFDGIAKPQYNFKAGQTYTLTIAGRSQRYSFDRFAFYMSDSAKACDPKTPESSTSPVGTIKTSHSQYLVPVLGNTAEVYSLTGQYFGRFPLSATGQIMTQGKIGAGNYITILPGKISQRRLVTHK